MEKTIIIMQKRENPCPIPKHERKCTDCFCLIIYIFVSFAILALTFYSLINYNIYSLITPTDSDQEMCGIDLDEHPYLYFVSPHVDSISRRVCVKECPVTQYDKLNCTINSKVSTCDSSPNEDHQKNVEIYATELFFDRLCLPEPSLMRQQIFESLLRVDLEDEKIVELGNHSKLILASIPATMIITILLLLLLRFTACFSIYLIILSLIGFLLFFSVYFYYNSTLASQQPKFFDYTTSEQTLLHMLSLGLLIVTITIIFIICSYRKYCSMAVELIKSSGKFLSQNWNLVTVAIAECICGLIVLVWWVVELWGLTKAKQIYLKNSQIYLNPNQLNFIQTLIVALHTFYLAWSYFFITHSGAFLIQGTVSNWYLSEDKNSLFSQSFDRYTGYHLGSICAGSFYTVIFGWVNRLISTFKPICLTKNMLSCQGLSWSEMICCLSLGNLLALCNRGIYTVINLNGLSYCESSSVLQHLKSREPILSNMLSILKLIFQFILRTQIVLLTILSVNWIISNVQPYSTQYTDSTLTLTCVGIVAFLVSQTFISLYSETVQSLLVCFLVDKENGYSLDNCPWQLVGYIQQVKQNYSALM